MDFQVAEREGSAFERYWRLQGCLPGRRYAIRRSPMIVRLGSSRIESAELYIKAQTMVIELVAGGSAEKVLFPDQPPLRAEHDKIEARAVAAIACASPRWVDAMLAYAEAEAGKFDPRKSQCGFGAGRRLGGKPERQRTGRRRDRKRDGP
jgi:hypothetical protein